MKFYCAVVAMMVLFVGCSSENEIVRQEDVISKVENPFNFVGELHNEGLAYVIDSMTAKTRAGETSSIEDVKYFVDKFCKEKFESDERLQLLCNDIESSIYKENEIITRSFNEEDSIYADSIFSDKAIEYLEKIECAASNYYYESIDESLSRLEMEILEADSTVFTMVEKNFLLTTIAVGKYSSEFWEEYESNDTTTRISLFKSPIVRADLVGAATGIWAARKIVLVSFVGGVQSGIITMARFAIPTAVSGSAMQWFVGG